MDVGRKTELFLSDAAILTGLAQGTTKRDLGFDAAGHGARPWRPGRRYSIDINSSSVLQRPKRSQTPDGERDAELANWREER